ncbi:response regulator transcription factor [Martelella sp. HB161492]|uniref:response regulator n=1 Tax=Martelella sp. HB161492 TaxID=2720726 RepID=UPI00159232D2|nr:response regulator transcription factor [Martelella sp. HB161492]
MTIKPEERDADLSPPAQKAGGAALCRIILSEDDPIIRERLSKLISAWQDGLLLASCGTLAETIEAISTHDFDLLITDLNLPDGNGIEAIEALRIARPEAQAMVISVLADDRTVLNSIEAGATGYLLKDADFTDLIEAITDLMAGRSPISSRIARILVKRLSAGTPETSLPDNGPKLTDREMDILWGISKGFTYAELAQRLEISRQTVPVHIRNIYRKLQVSNRSEAVFEAARQGLIKL